MLVVTPVETESNGGYYLQYSLPAPSIRWVIHQI